MFGFIPICISSLPPVHPPMWNPTSRPPWRKMIRIKIIKITINHNNHQHTIFITTIIILPKPEKAHKLPPSGLLLLSSKIFHAPEPGHGISIAIIIMVIAIIIMIIMNIIFIILLNLIMALSLQWWILWSSWTSPPQYQHLTMNLIILIIMQKLLLLILYITLRVTGIIYNYHDHDYPCAHQSNQNPHDHQNHQNPHKSHHHLLNSILGLLGTTDGLVGPVVLFCLILFL